jgi:hypothetical protein
MQRRRFPPGVYRMEENELFEVGHCGSGRGGVWKSRVILRQIIELVE